MEMANVKRRYHEILGITRPLNPLVNGPIRYYSAYVSTVLRAQRERDTGVGGAMDGPVMSVH